MEYLPTGDLEKGRVYQLDARRAAYGVWDGNARFIEIQTEMNELVLSAETHWDLHGSAKPIAPTPVIASPDVVLSPYLPGPTGRIDNTPMRELLAPFERWPEDALAGRNSAEHLAVLRAELES
jgi:hypothetical protein